MTVIFYMWALLNFGSTAYIFETNIYKGQSNANCVAYITKYVFHQTPITIVEMSDVDPEMQEILKTLNKNMLFPITYDKKYAHQLFNKGYIIYVENPEVLTSGFKNIRGSLQFPSTSRFIILLKNNAPGQIQNIFNEMLLFHAYYVIAIDLSNGQIITYMPFDSMCDPQLNSIIDLGYCNNSYELYDLAERISLRNCTFKALAPHWPPYSLDPRKSDMIGTDQYALELLAEAEGFKIEYTFKDIAEEFSDVSSNMSATGPLACLQNNSYDIVLGSLMLNEKRASAFDILYNHFVYADEINVFVPMAKLTPKWKRVYLEFNVLVWALLGSAFVLYASITIVLVTTDHQSYQIARVILKLYDNLLSHSGCDIRGGFVVKCLLMHWIFFTVLINSYYQTSLMSLTTQPSREFQVKTIEDLKRHNFKPCASDVMKSVLNWSDMVLGSNNNKCKSVISSMFEVCNSKNMYTFAPDSLYQCRRYLFTDDIGYSGLYRFHQPVQKFVTAIYLYKGFPVVRRLNRRTQLFREHGLMQRALLQVNDYYMWKHHSDIRKHAADSNVLKLSDMKLHFFILFLGLSVSTLVFVMEIAF